MQNQEPWVSIDSVVQHLGIAKDTVYRWINAKHLPAHRVGRLWKFRLSEIDSWIQSESSNRNASLESRLALTGRCDAGKAGQIQRETSAQPRVYRPFQYLGTKLRSMESVVEAVSILVPTKGHVVDLFSGSSVVSQALADGGHRVTAFDALAFCTEAAKATLGVNRAEGDDLSTTALELIELSHSFDFHDDFANWLAEEDASLAHDDGARALQVGLSAPQIWRPAGASESLRRQFQQISANTGKSCFTIGPVVSTHYAGTYFGIRQALAIDSLRWAIESLSLTPWLRSSALTALAAAMSAAVFSPGKHFAQPHKIVKDKDLSFHERRALTDRSVDIHEVFLSAVERLATRGAASGSGHTAETRTMESLKDCQLGDVDVVYADPPYTAQQYSRFYHVPEVIVSGIIPAIQNRVDGDVTSGLYHNDRFKSRFCSKKHAVTAFAEMINLAKTWGAALAISYAGSGSGKSGNDRMVTLDELLSLMKSAGFRHVAVQELTHKYRQLNNSNAAVDGRTDIEFLVTGASPC